MADLDGLAGERLVTKKQLTQGATAQFIHMQTVALQGTTGRHAAGEYPGLAVTAQIHLAYPANTGRWQVEGGAFVVSQGLPAFEQWRDAETIVGEVRQAAGQ